MKIKTEIINIKKLKKDGTLSEEHSSRIYSMLKEGAVAVMPVDNVYKIVGKSAGTIRKVISKIKNGHEEIITLIASFKMLNDIVHYSKSDYDFLNRIWPGEVNVILKSARGKNEKRDCVRFPRNRFVLNIIEEMDFPLYASVVSTDVKETIFRKRDIVNLCDGIVDYIIIVDELCKKHPPATIIDIRNQALNIIKTGKISSEEIKSLYFLGKADE